MDVKFPNRAERDPAAVRRFGWALVASSVLVVGVAGLVYVRNPTSSLQPHIVASSSGFNRAGFARAGVLDPGVQDVLARFVNALERHDDSAMRSAWPTMKPHDTRVLQALHKRLGESAHLSIDHLRMKSGAPADVWVDFLILSNSDGRAEVLRLPFEGHVSNVRGVWEIVELR